MSVSEIDTQSRAMKVAVSDDELTVDLVDGRKSLNRQPAAYPPRVRLPAPQPIPPPSLDGTRAKLQRRSLGCCSLIPLCSLEES